MLLFYSIEFVFLGELNINLLKLQIVDRYSLCKSRVEKILPQKHQGTIRQLADTKQESLFIVEDSFFRRNDGMGGRNDGL